MQVSLVPHEFDLVHLDKKQCYLIILDIDKKKKCLNIALEMFFDVRSIYWHIAMVCSVLNNYAHYLLSIIQCNIQTNKKELSTIMCYLGGSCGFGF